MKKILKKSIALVIAAFTVIGIAACDGPHFKEQPEPPVLDDVSTNTPKDTELNNETEEHQPSDDSETTEIPDEENKVIEKTEYDPVSESYIELLYSRYFQFSYSMFSPLTMFYKDTEVTVDDIDSSSKKAFAYAIFWNRDGRIAENEIDIFYYYNAELLESRVRSLFGPEAEVDKGGFAGWSSISMNYSSITGEYIGYTAMGGDFPDQFMNKIDSYEQDGEFLYIYDKIMFKPENSTENGVSDNGSLVAAPAESPWEWKNRITDEIFEQNCITYKHTFKRYIDGTYYWVSSEPSEGSGTKTVSEPAFTENFAKELYDKYFTCRSAQNYMTENMYFTNKVQTAADLNNEQKQAIVWFVGGEYQGFDFADGNVTISQENFETKLRQYLGEDATVEHNDFSAGGFDFIYDADKAQYVGTMSTSPIVTPNARSMNKYGSFELDGEYLYLYDEYLYVVYSSLEPNSEGKYDVVYNNNSVDRFEIWFNTTNVNSYQGNAVDDTFLNICGYTYKHTFKQNPDGTYHWVSSEPTA